mmetsp:Transcript_8004/g.15628  ORF Transcript_8004/g.15628 Transcript_8004/m.15628 type:complete len:104 (-) Transcript_8004:153-464(-)
MYCMLRRSISVYAGISGKQKVRESTEPQQKTRFFFRRSLSRTKQNPHAGKARKSFLSLFLRQSLKTRREEKTDRDCLEKSGERRGEERGEENTKVKNRKETDK